MPASVRSFEIDWGWPQLSEVERCVVRRHQARAHADPGAQTLATLKEALAAASCELPGRVIRSRIVDEHGKRALSARDGRCSDATDESFDEEGKYPDPLTADDYRAAGVEKLCVGLFWPESMLEAIQTQACRLDRSFSWVVEKAWIIAKDVASTSTGGNSLPRDGDRRKQSIYLPIEIYAELADIARREERSMSVVVQRALTAAWPTVTTMPAT
jgi:uncharacterized small protein (TIGR04563 family)